MAERVAFIVVIVDGFSRLEFNRLSPLFDKYIDAVDPPIYMRVIVEAA
jgi:hypothetical protein